MNAGYGSCLLSDPNNSKIVADALNYFNHQRYILDEWVIMPNHVHVIVRPINKNELADIIHSWKSYTANEINKRMERTGQLWMAESYDHIIRNEKSLEIIRNYIRLNPTSVPGGVGAGGAGAGSSSYIVNKASSPRNEDVGAGSSNYINSRTSHIDQKLNSLFSYSDSPNPFNDYETSLIINAIDNCKILDPSCGSGAFPMGILHKLVHILHKLDPKNRLWKERQVEKVKKLIEQAGDISDSDVKDKVIKDLEDNILDIEAAFENNELDYGRKLYLIENCIYGVDIQPIATQISKLRFFISLIVDQKSDKDRENFGVRPLPNLETKFVAANTLIGIEKPGQDRSLFDNPKVKALESKLKDVRHRLFSAKTPTTKRKLRDEDQQIREEMGQILQNAGWSNESARQLAGWDPYNQNVSSNWFDPEWMFGVVDGFDVVIGNPPYGAKYSSEQKYFNENYVSARTIRGIQKGSLDTYIIY